MLRMHVSRAAMLIGVTLIGNPAYATRGLNKAALHARGQRISERKAARREIYDAVVTATREAREAFDNVLKNDARLAGEILKYGHEVETVAALNQKAQAFASDYLKKKYHPLFEAIFKRAGIDKKKYQEKIEMAVRKAAIHGPFQGKRAQFYWDDYLTYYLRWESDPTPEAPPASVLDELNLVLAPPFQNEQSEGDRNLIDLDEGMFLSEGHAQYAGSNNTVAGLGAFVDIPGGYSDMRVTATLPDSKYFLASYAILGGSASSSSSTIEVYLDNDIICERTFDHGSLQATFGWYAMVRGIDTFNVSCNVDAPTTDTEVVFSFYNESDTWAVVNAGSDAQTIDTPRDLKIRLRP